MKGKQFVSFVHRFLSYVTLLAALAAIIASGFGTVAHAGSHSPQGGSAPLVHLPADQAAHMAAENEWWYLVGHLHHGARTFGYEVTVFKLNHVTTPGLRTPISLYRTDLAITDEVGKRFLHRVTYYFPQSGMSSSHTLRVQVGPVSLRGSTPQNMALRAAFGSNAINLHLVSRRPAMNVGGRGYITFGNGYSYYYSLTDLASQGSLRVNGVSYAVTGISWLDHQWGKWNWQTIRGWEWMALQLNNGAQLSVFDFRGTTSRVEAASVLMANGGTRTISQGVTFTPIRHWRSPVSSALYPSGLVVRIPALHATLRVTPTVLNQEMTSPSQLQISYWEGSSRVTGTFSGKPVSGLAYTELTGYAGRSIAG